nr:unnamed protein product [Timema douglasi]
MDIVSSERCHLNYLEVRDGYWRKSRLIGESSYRDIL